MCRPTFFEESCRVEKMRPDVQSKQHQAPAASTLPPLVPPSPAMQTHPFRERYKTLIRGYLQQASRALGKTDATTFVSWLGVAEKEMRFDEAGMQLALEGIEVARTDFAHAFESFAAFAADSYEDLLGELYEEYGYGGYNGSFYTPWDVAQVMARLAWHECQPVDGVITLLDPACGSGTLLLAGMEHCWSQFPDADLRVSGQDINRNAVVMARINIELRLMFHRLTRRQQSLGERRDRIAALDQLLKGMSTNL